MEFYRGSAVSFLFFSVSVTVSVFWLGPPLLSQADFIAGFWTCAIKTGKMIVFPPFFVPFFLRMWVEGQSAEGSSFTTRRYVIQNPKFYSDSFLLHKLGNYRFLLLSIIELHLKLIMTFPFSKLLTFVYTSKVKYCFSLLTYFFWRLDRKSVV